MSWRSWLFPNSPAARAEKAIRDAQRQTNAVMQPLIALTLGILSTSWECTQKVTPHIRPHPQDHALQHILIYCEFLLFSFFLMSLSGFNCGLPPSKYSKLKELIMLLIVHPTVDTYFAHLKDSSELERLLYEGLRKGDTYYGSSENCLLSLVKNVITISGYDINKGRSDPKTSQLMNLVDREVIQILSSGSLRSENLKEMVQRASAAIDVYESDGSSLAQMFRDERREKTSEREMQRA